MTIEADQQVSKGKSVELYWHEHTTEEAQFSRLLMRVPGGRGIEG